MPAPSARQQAALIVSLLFGFDSLRRIFGVADLTRHDQKKLHHHLVHILRELMRGYPGIICPEILLAKRFRTGQKGLSPARPPPAFACVFQDRDALAVPEHHLPLPRYGTSQIALPDNADKPAVYASAADNK